VGVAGKPELQDRETCFQSRRTLGTCQQCGGKPDVSHFTKNVPGCFCEKCCPACNPEPAERRGAS